MENQKGLRKMQTVCVVKGLCKLQKDNVEGENKKRRN